MSTITNTQPEVEVLPALTQLNTTSDARKFMMQCAVALRAGSMSPAQGEAIAALMKANVAHINSEITALKHGVTDKLGLMKF